MQAVLLGTLSQPNRWWVMNRVRVIQNDDGPGALVEPYLLVALSTLEAAIGAQQIQAWYRDGTLIRRRSP